MTTDIFLNEKSVAIEADTSLSVHAADLVLSHPKRRISSKGPRRALVHSMGDGLTINFGSDYPGGVTINGAVHVPGSLAAHRVVLDLRPRAAAYAGGDPVLDLVGGEHSVALPAHDEIKDSFLFDDPGGATVDLSNEIRRLRLAVAKLNERLELLGG